MSKVAIEGNALGSGTFTIASPNTNTSYTLTLPQGTGTFVASGVNSSIVSGTSQASTSGTSIDFTGIPSWVKRITVILDEVSLSGTANLLFQLGDSGGFETTGYLSATSLTRDGAGINGLASTTGFAVFLAVATREASGRIVFENLSGNGWVGSGVFSIFDLSGTVQVAGSKTLSATLDRVRVTTTNGTDTFDAGSINILYE
jgi:hypothetical protein